MRRCLVALVLLFAVPAPAGADLLAHGLTQLQRDAANDCRFAGVCSDDIAAYERSDTHRTLAFQYALADGLPLRDAPWMGTHNSFNSATEMGPSCPTATPTSSCRCSTSCSTCGARARPALLRDRPVVCHAEGDPPAARSSTHRPGAGEIDGWLRDHPSQVILLYLEDHLGAQAGHDAGADDQITIGPRVYRPTGGGSGSSRSR